MFDFEKKIHDLYADAILFGKSGGFSTAMITVMLNKAISITASLLDEYKKRVREENENEY